MILQDIIKGFIYLNKYILILIFLTIYYANICFILLYIYLFYLIEQKFYYRTNKKIIERIFCYLKTRK